MHAENSKSYAIWLGIGEQRVVVCVFFLFLLRLVSIFALFNHLDGVSTGISLLPGIIYRLIGMNKRRSKRNCFAKMCQLLKPNDTYRHTHINFLAAHELPMRYRISSFILLIKTNISTYLTFASDANIYLHLRSFRLRNTLCIISTDRSHEYVHINLCVCVRVCVMCVYNL